MSRRRSPYKSFSAVTAAGGVSVESDAVVGLIGRDGAGKTTLMCSVMGLLAPSAGSVEFSGTALARTPTHARARNGIGHMPQDRRLLPDLTVEQSVLIPAWSVGIKDATARLGLYVDPRGPRVCLPQGLAVIRQAAESGGSGSRSHVRYQATAAQRAVRRCRTSTGSSTGRSDWWPR
ncbi:MAG: ATP-binding cassette domain-containing protein [Betaproteobacteria bacterium]|nr:MAG: ATP-binding cassette domain-containing protein [Betaproteobacteria bacterium]